MENFVLYEQVGQGDHCTIYKGRRKDTINFLAIHCADKCKRPEITNMVRLMHEMNHKNIVCFYEWYETTNHIWLIVELCTGGSLEKLISEDGHLPEVCIRKFGADLVNGLHQIHSVGIVFSDIKPSKILFNGPGHLKYADFGLSRLDGENLDQLLESYMDGGEGFGNLDNEIMKSDSSDVPKRLRTRGTATYMAPEVLMGEEPSYTSDFWSLGCVFYEMFAGHPPFQADSFQQLQQKILDEELGPVKLRGSRTSSGKPSAEFQSLLDGLLERDPKRRMNWLHLVAHPFWDGELKNLVTDDVTLSSELRQSFHRSIVSFSTQMSLAGGCIGLKQTAGCTELRDDIDSRQDTPKEMLKNLHNLRSDNACSEPQVLFTISARPCTARGLDDDSAGTEEHLTVKSVLKLSQEALHPPSAQQQLDKYSDQNDILSLIFHASDFQTTSVIDMAKQSQKISLKYDVKALSVPPCQAEKLASMSPQDQESHLVAVMESVNVTEKGPTSQKQIQLFNYIGSICSNSCIANALVRRGIMTLFSRQVKDTQQLELKSRLCFIIGSIASNVTELDPSIAIGEAISILTEAVRDGFRVPKIKLTILPALGEILYLVATQEESRCAQEYWSVPSLTYNLIIKCLNEGEEAAVYQFAIKIIENVATTTGQHALKFASNEVAQQLWNIFMHAKSDALRIPSLSALARLSRISPSITQNIFIDKVGVQKLLAALNVAVTKIQQAAITIIAVIIVSDTTREKRIIQDKHEIMNHVMRLLESPSVVIRAKAFLVVTVLITGNRELLLAACQNRLVMYMERDRRKQAVGKVENVEQAKYLNKCLDWLMLEMVDVVPQVSKELLTALDSVMGRKHPSSGQIKQLKNSLPLLALLLHMVSSTAFRSKIISKSFIKNLSSFLGHILGIETGVTAIQPANAPFGGREEFIRTVFTVVENVVQHPNHVIDYAAVIVDSLLPSLSAIISTCTGETRTLSLRIFSEIIAIFVNHDSADSELIQQQTKKLHQLVIDSILPQFEQILLDQDPLPLHGLKLLLALVEQHPSFIKDIEKFNLIPVFFQVLVDHQSNPVCSTMQQVAGLLNSLVTRKETNMKNLYDHGFVEHFNYLFHEVSSICLAKGENSNTKATSTMLLLLLETFHGTLKYISDVVRRALEIKKGDGDNATAEAEQAETLLLLNKPLTDFVSPLTQLLMHEDSDISDTALKCLAQLLQFFGGEHANSLSARNMECYSEFLKKADLKKQKIVLRLIKRLIATDAHQLEMMKLHGTRLAETIKTVEQNAGAKAEIALSTLATEILKAAGYKN